MTRQEVLDFMKRRPTQEEWLRGYRQWKKQMEKEIAKDKRTDS